MHEQFLLAALELAKKGQGHCAPNPCVGAIAVQNNKIIAQGWHQGAGTPHAEQVVFAKIPPNLPGVRLYSTLEPCNHWGRTPPCVDVIIESGIQEVIFSYLDPNPVVAANNSTEKLRQKGIQVTHVPLAEIDAFYKSYNHWTLTKKPWVTVKIAHTLDGKIAGPNGERCQLSNALCDQFTHQKRAESDVLLTSARTVLQDNPRFNVRLSNQEYSKPVAIIDSHLSLHPQLNLFSKAAHCLVYHGEQASDTLKSNYINSSFYTMPIKDGKMDLSAVIAHLGSLGFHDIFVEVGGELFTNFHQKGLVNKTYLYLVPKILGNKALTTYQEADVFQKPHAVSWYEMGDNMIACLDWQEDECLPV